ncbi:TPA: flagellar hook-length control protein FliK [Citrobacter freundii]
MNPVLLASASAENAASATQEIAPGQGLETSGTTQTFSLSQSTQTSAEQIRGAKAAHQQAMAADKKSDDTDPTAMQALLAMLLSQQQSQNPAEMGVTPGNGALQKLAAATGNNGHSPVLRQLAESLARAANSAKDSDAFAGQNGNPSDLTQLSPKLQGLLASLTQQTSTQTASQQASLAKFSAQDLHAIAPAQPTVAERVANRTKPAENLVRPGVAKKNGEINSASGPTAATTTAAMQLHAINLQTVQGNSHDLKLAHSALPADIQADEWGDKLTALLKDRIQFQLSQQQQVSTIRLDPPSLGKLEIAVQLDAGKLMVHIGANQSDVLHSLQQFSDDLRQHLTQQNFMEVNVQVSSEGQSQQQQQSGQQQEEVMSALALNDEPQYQQNESVLIKV